MNLQFQNFTHLSDMQWHLLKFDERPKFSKFGHFKKNCDSGQTTHIFVTKF